MLINKVCIFGPIKKEVWEELCQKICKIFKIHPTRGQCSFFLEGLTCVSFRLDCQTLEEQKILRNFLSWCRRHEVSYHHNKCGWGVAGQAGKHRFKYTGFWWHNWLEKNKRSGHSQGVAPVPHPWIRDVGWFVELT